MTNSLPRTTGGRGLSRVAEELILVGSTIVRNDTRINSFAGYGMKYGDHPPYADGWLATMA